MKAADVDGFVFLHVAEIWCKVMGGGTRQWFALTPWNPLAHDMEYMLKNGTEGLRIGSLWTPHSKFRMRREWQTDDVEFYASVNMDRDDPRLGEAEEAARLYKYWTGGFLQYIDWHASQGTSVAWESKVAKLATIDFILGQAFEALTSDDKCFARESYELALHTTGLHRADADRVAYPDSLFERLALEAAYGLAVSRSRRSDIIEQMEIDYGWKRNPYWRQEHDLRMIPYAHKNCFVPTPLSISNQSLRGKNAIARARILAEARLENRRLCDAYQLQVDKPWEKEKE